MFAAIKRTRRVGGRAAEEEEQSSRSQSDCVFKLAADIAFGAVYLRREHFIIFQLIDLSPSHGDEGDRNQPAPSRELRLFAFLRRSQRKHRRVGDAGGGREKENNDEIKDHFSDDALLGFIKRTSFEFHSV